MTQIAAFSSDKIGGGPEILTLDGRCELSTALHAEQQIISALDAGATEIIFDLRGVTWLDRSLLQVLFRARIRMGRRARLMLVRPNAHVWELFEESGLDRGFASVRDLKAALAELSVAARPVGSASATRLGSEA
jgi:anti-anti-sigma factor